MKIQTVGHALSLFFAISFALAVLLASTAFMELPMTEQRGMMMGGMHARAFPGVIIGLVVAYGLGWYAALVFVPLYNFFNKKGAQ